MLATRAAATTLITSLRMLFSSLRASSSRAPPTQALLEPVMRVRFVVELWNFGVTRATIQRNRLREHMIRLEANRPSAVVARVPLQFGQQSRAHADAAPLRIHPHPFQFSGRLRMEFQRAAADGALPRVSKQ